MEGLKNEADLKSAIARLIIKIGNRFSSIEQGPIGRPVKRPQHLQEGRFSAAARTGNGKEFALRHAKADTPQRLHLSVIIFFRGPNGLEDKRQGGGRGVK